MFLLDLSYIFALHFTKKKKQGQSDCDKSKSSTSLVIENNILLMKIK